MTTRNTLSRLCKWSLAPGIVLIVLGACLQPLTQAQGPNAGENPEGAQVLTRGPVHEAFGQPTVFNPKPGMLIPKKPPEAVEELPPEEKPQGENIAWIGGYWSWEEDKTDFLWVSGIWRALPPGRQWMPGYWNEDEGQHQWVSGYWSPIEQQEQEFIQEAPKDTLEQGPPPTAPSDDHIWIPGTWVHRTSRYMWRPGYWVINQPGWVWIPACYYWTPSGYCFIDGFWDWSIRRRGVIFAPCYFNSVVVRRPGFYYRPSICLDIDIITPHFFCRPSYGHYYFGDYYASNYLSIGITPWFNFTYARGGFYSSDFSYYECHYRRANPRWALELRVGYERCRDNIGYRPPRTYVDQRTIINNITVNNTTINNTKIVNRNVDVKTISLAKPLKDVSLASSKDADAPVKFERITDAKARDFGKTASEVRKVGLQRVNLESAKTTRLPGRVPGKVADANTGSIKKVTLPRSPIVSRMPTNTGESTANTGGAADANRSSRIGGVSGRASNLPPPVPGKEVGKTSGGVIGNTGGINTGRTTPPIMDKTGSIGNADPKKIPEKTGRDRIPPLGNTKDTPAKTDPPKNPGKIDPPRTGGSTGASGGVPRSGRIDPPAGGSSSKPGGSGSKIDPPKTGGSSGAPRSGGSTGGSSGGSRGGSSGSNKDKEKEKGKDKP